MNDQNGPTTMDQTGQDRGTGLELSPQTYYTTISCDHSHRTSKLNINKVSSILFYNLTKIGDKEVIVIGNKNYYYSQNTAELPFNGNGLLRENTEMFQ